MGSRYSHGNLIKLLVAAFLGFAAVYGGYSFYSDTVDDEEYDGPVVRQHDGKALGAPDPLDPDELKPAMGADFDSPSMKHHAAVEESILNAAQAGRIDGSLFVSPGSASGLWAFYKPGNAPPEVKDTRETQPTALDKSPLRLILHRQQVSGRCVFALIESGARQRISWRDSAHAKGSFIVGNGISTAKVACYGDDPPSTAGRMRLSLFDPDRLAGPKAFLHGLWLVPDGSEPPEGLPGPRECDEGRGWKMEPGDALTFAVLATPKSRLVMMAGGKGAAGIRVDYVFDGPMDKKSLAIKVDGSNNTAYGSWELPFERAEPMRVDVVLQPGAPGGLCLNKLSLHHKKKDPTIAGRQLDVDSVVFILVDTLRADSLSVINPSSPVKTPNFDALAGESVMFTNLVAASHYTKPSMATVLTGVYGSKHGALATNKRLAPSVPLLSERLRKAGVDTQAIFSNLFFNNRKFGFQRGWNYQGQVNAHVACVSGEPVAELIDKWTHKWKPGGKFFSYIHLMDPHAPYSPPSSFEIEYLGHRLTKGRFLPLQTADFLCKVRRGAAGPPSAEELARLKGLYHADVAHSDKILGDVLKILDESGILDKALLIVTSDHGEEFMEHGMLGHATNVHRELIHVPLFMRWPGGKVTGTVNATVGHIDLAPTMLEVFDVPKPSIMKFGRSLFDLMRGDKVNWGKRAYLAEHKNTSIKGVVSGRWELILGKKEPELSYTNGSGEQSVSVDSHPIAWQYLRRRLVELMAGRNLDDAGEASVDVELSEEELEKLKAIGYILE